MSYDVNRIRYFDPVVENYRGQGSLEDTINDKYEDFNIAVDLTVEITDRYSCGFAYENNQKEERTYSSTNGSISFLNGTNGFLTTNYTDISMLNPSRNTNECLGIESINITYDSWMHPQITIKFVDVRGATVFQPAEYGYYNDKASMSTSFLYKALFSFPYPLFKLTVKGFYGKGVTYHLSVFNTKMELDANNGNFVITVNFIGFMYGIFSDIPMTYIGIAPYTEKGSKYWEESINTNEKFMFENIDGSKTKMIKFPELLVLLAKASEQLDKMEEKEEESAIASDDELNSLNTIVELFKKIDFLEGSDTTPIANAGPGDRSNNYVWVYEEVNGDLDALFLTIQKYESEYTTINAYKPDGKDAPYFWNNGFLMTSEYLKWSEGKDQGKIKFYYTYKEKALSKTLENALNRIETVQTEHNTKIEEYNSKRMETIKKCIGFDPTIKNMYNLAFAHMDTFMEFFYDHMRKIKDQLDSNDEKRKKSHYIENDEIETDTNRSDLASSVASSFRNGEYLPPFTSFYTRGDLQSGGKVMEWVEKLFPGKANDLEETILVKELFNGAKIYFSEAQEACKILDSIGNGEGGTVVNDLIPQTTFDIANSVAAKNPYMLLKGEFDSSSSYENLYAEVLYVFMTRLFNFKRWQGIYFNTDANSVYDRFGETEAINFYLAIKDDYRMKDFIKVLTSDFNGEEALNVCLGKKEAKHDSALNVIKEMGNGSLLTEQDGNCTYQTIKKGDKEYLPVSDISISNTRRVCKEDNIGDTDFSVIKFIDVGEFSTKNTFKIIEDGSYFTKLSEGVCSYLEDANEKHTFLTDENIGVNFKYDINAKEVENVHGFYNKACITEDGFIQNPSICKPREVINSGKNQSIFDEDGFGKLYNLQDDIKGKAMLFLQSVPMEYDSYYQRYEGHGVQQKNENDVLLNVSLLREGSFYWLEDNPNAIKTGSEYKGIVSTESGETKIRWFRKSGKSTFGHEYHHINIYEPLKKNSEDEYQVASFTTFSDSRRETLKKYFEDWATGSYQPIEEKLRTKLKPRVEYTSETSYSDFDPEPYVETTETYHYGLDKNDTSTDAQKIQEFLTDLLVKQVGVIDYYSNVGFVKGGTVTDENLHTISSASIKSSFDSFISTLKTIYSDLIEGRLSNEAVTELGRSILENPFRNPDFYHSEYMSLKSLYDKWLCSPYGNRKWKFSSSDSEFNNFYYVDSFFNNIGNLLDVNIVKLAEWLSDVIPTSSTDEEEALMGWHGKTLYDYMVDLAVDCGGMLLALPQKIGNTNPSEMFKPYSVCDDWRTDSSCFMFIYSYRPSERLGDYDLGDLDMNGYSPEGDGFNLTDAEIVGKLFGGADGQTVPAFGVTFAKQNQSYFKNLSLNSETNGASEAAIAATMNIAAKADESNGTSLSLYGQDLYKVFSNYSYECTVETMGNMMIMPPMYFQLNNVPLWKGAYMIKKVEHNIVAGDMTTRFTGLRQNKYAIPFVRADVSTLGIINSDGYFGTIGEGITEFSTEFDLNEPPYVGPANKTDWLTEHFGRSTNLTSDYVASYMTEIEVDITNFKNVETTYKIKVHRDYAEEIKQIFREIKSTGYKITYIHSQSYRHTSTGNGNMSNHTWGIALDLNGTTVDEQQKLDSKLNPFPPDCKHANKYKPLKDTNADSNTRIRTYSHPVVQVFRSHGWGWGGRYGDYMHFSLFNGC